MGRAFALYMVTRNLVPQAHQSQEQLLSIGGVAPKQNRLTSL